MTSCYLDASALVKLATHEVETDALRAHLEQYSTHATSRLATVEVPRALARKGTASVITAESAWQETIERLVVIELTDEIARAAASAEPVTLRSLDAIHLATALAVGPELDAFVTYDVRLADAAKSVGLTVVAPSEEDR